MRWVLVGWCGSGQSLFIVLCPECTHQQNSGYMMILWDGWRKHKPPDIYLPMHRTRIANNPWIQRHGAFGSELPSFFVLPK